MDSETELVERCLLGDCEAFARLIDPYQQVALRVAYAIAGPDAEDVVQDALVKAYTRLDQFRRGAGFRPWLLAIVANEARNRLRGLGRRSVLELRVAGQRQGDAPDPAVEATKTDTRQRLLSAVADLPVRDREVLALRYFAELSEAETAAALGCAVGTVKSRAHRALTRLRVELAEEVSA